MESGSSGAGTDAVRCAECGTVLAEDQERVATAGGVFCARCFAALRDQVQQVVAAQSTDINYPAAAIGAVLGGALGALVWWGFTVATKVSFGLVAVVIGLAVGKGTTLFAGGKRARGLQMLAVVVAGLAFLYASYLVNRSLIQRSVGEVKLPLLPGIRLFFHVVSLGFGIFDVVFLAIVLWEAWRIPAPFKLRWGGSAGARTAPQ